ncbi:transcription factor Zn, C2H2 [Metarhizium robertsii ARSEF 23]|uniref:Transcription factor Zn, C2H2 n=1 Tax=Metarhizium robertsii (strain ARSEF 23 / ATCC MYA-3075) TaxID=655844 RepID=E9FB75_METRA|nr:transcription factor Zn, C2H2 [Metarhizium robertsii ARSEF 23]EFY95075.2 transcription factor Zn, C2H2 [Metarhizium robertsii ARSEF 23]
MDSIAEGSELFEVAYHCLDLFEKCLVESGRQQALIVQEVQARFNLWAAYTGVFADNDKSLDTRLFLHPDVKRMTLNLLRMVERNLQLASTANINQHSQLPVLTDIADLDENSNLSKLLESHGASFRGLVAVPVALDRLHKLATAIRRSSLESRKENLLTKIWDSDSEKYLGECICKFIREKFPAARASLIKQLAAAVCASRRRLLYLPRHNKKLGIERKGKQTGVVKGSLLPHELLRKRYYGDAFTEPISATDASIPNTIQLRRELGRVKRPAISVASAGIIQGESLLYPDIPAFAADKKLHPCPYCSEPLLTSRLDLKVKANRDYWRNHVNQDLEPYFCLSEECKEPLKFFIHYRDWLDHMSTFHTDEWYRSAHALTWYCDLGHKERELFVDRDSFESHSQDHHPNLTASQRRARTKKSKTLALREPLACPLCESVPAKISSLAIQHQNSAECKDALCKHIAFHLKALSLLSFRLLNEQSIDHIDDTEAEEHHTTQIMTRSMQNMPLETAEKISWPSLDSSWISENANPGLAEHGLETVDANTGGVDWGRFPGFDHLSKYSGVRNLESHAGPTPMSEAEGTQEQNNQAFNNMLANMSREQWHEIQALPPDERHEVLGKWQNRQPQQFPNDMSKLGQSDGAKVIDLAAKMMEMTSDQQKAATRMSLQRRLSPQQLAEIQARGRDPLVLFFQNQAFQVLKRNMLRLQGQNQTPRQGQEQPEQGSVNLQRLRVDRAAQLSQDLQQNQQDVMARGMPLSQSPTMNTLNTPESNLPSGMNHIGGQALGQGAVLFGVKSFNQGTQQPNNQVSSNIPANMSPEQ